jgi:hypothetical protein
MVVILNHQVSFIHSIPHVRLEAREASASASCLVIERILTNSTRIPLPLSVKRLCLFWEDSTEMHRDWD